jgi:uncharacterized membrane protein
MSLSRMESFSDGVFAVAITLLSLGLLVPGNQHHTLAHALLEQWPRYAAYAVSFLTIGIIWINHHVAIRRLVRPDHALLVLNLLLLMSVTAIPFATDLMATYLGSDHGGDIAMAVYSGVLAWMGVTFVAFNWFVLFRRPQLMDPELGEFSSRYVISRSALGIVPYFVAIGCAFVSPYVSLIISFLVVLYYAFPIGQGRLI